MFRSLLFFSSVLTFVTNIACWFYQLIQSYVKILSNKMSKFLKHHLSVCLTTHTISLCVIECYSKTKLQTPQKQTFVLKTSIQLHFFFFLKSKQKIVDMFHLVHMLLKSKRRIMLSWYVVEMVKFLNLLHHSIVHLSNFYPHNSYGSLASLVRNILYFLVALCTLAVSFGSSHRHALSAIVRGRGTT